MMSFSGWTLKLAFTTVVFAAATFAIAFVLGNSITMAFGPGTSGIVSAVVTTMLVVICANIVERLGVFTVLVTLFTILAIPTQLFGPAGPHKILIGFATGVTYDLVWYGISRTPLKNIALPVAAAAATCVSILLVLWLMTYLDHPRVDFLRRVIAYVAPLYAVLGFVGALLGNAVYRRIKDLSAVARLKAG